MTPKILCDINDKINFNISGQSQSADIGDLTNPDNIKRIYRIQFSKEPSRQFLSTAVNIISNNPTIPLRFYGDYSEDKIDWESLQPIKKLQVDLWQTNKLAAISKLTGLTELGITKNVKSSVSLKILEPLTDLETLFVSIPKDIESISSLKNLKFLSLREIKTKDLNFISSLSELGELWLSLGSYDNFDAITKLPSLKRLSVHQVKGFDNETANNILSKCISLQYLQLQDLKHITALDFIAFLKNLRYLNLDGIKNLSSYSPISANQNLETISAADSRPADKDLTPLLHLKNIWLGDSYGKASVDKFSSQFRGQSFWNRGKDIVGDLRQNHINPFDLLARQ
jgi:hypothetical protein